MGVGQLKWSATLAVYAQRWADHLAATTCKMAHRTEHRHGENLFQGTSGHYTAVGCSEAVCDKTLIVVCNYDPPGNTIGRRPY